MIGLCVFTFILLLPKHCSAGVFSTIINKNTYDATGMLAAFGDFNADKMVDIFVIDDNGKRVDILQADPDKQFVRVNLINSTDPIVRIMLADFNADQNMDVLVVRKQAPSLVDIEIYWGNDNKHSVKSVPFSFNESFTDDPVLFDYNGDMLPDLLVETEPGRRIVWLATGNSNFFVSLNITADTSSAPLAIPNSCAFVNIHDYGSDTSPGGSASDLVVTTQGAYEVYLNGDVSEKSYRNYQSVDAETFSSSFADFNQDGIIDHVVPACQNNGQCGIYVYYVNPETGDGYWYQMYTADSDSTFKTNVTEFDIPPTLRIGDYDMDGYPDIVIVMTSLTDGGQRAYLLQNIECNGQVNCTGYGRMFVKRDELPDISNTVVATFFDFDEDGILDVVMTTMTYNGSYASYKLVFLKNNLAADTCFLKVTVISGLCSHEDGCKSPEPYGVNVPGPTVNYTTTNTNGHVQKLSAGQLSQSCHFALQLPFVIFGLGQTPNFVDHIGIAIPQNNSVRISRSREWLQIVPNSQLIVITKPLDDPPSWKMKLFVTPSKQIWLTGIAMTATCVLVALIVGGLHLQERREDNKEKKQESQKFHFDAM